MSDSYASKDVLEVADSQYTYYRIKAVPGSESLPFSLRILIENLLRTEDGVNVRQEHIAALASWDPQATPATEIQFTPGRVLMQDFTGVPCVVDLATMREALAELGGDPAKVNPLAPAELVIDHSVQVDSFARRESFARNVALEYERNRERYQFLRWGQSAFDNFKVVPPGTGIVHQVNIEYLARVVIEQDGVVYPDTCVGTDSHTTMVNGLGVLGWGVGGIEAEAAMLGQPVSMLIPKVVGFKLTGTIPAVVTATDVVLTITELLRSHGVVGKFVEFYGDGISQVPLPNRTTIGNMSPEFGSTCAIFPIDQVTLDYLTMTGRDAHQVELVAAYAKAQGLWHDPHGPEARYSEYLELDLSTVVPSIAGPRRPQDRIDLVAAPAAFATALPTVGGGGSGTVHVASGDYELSDGDVVIASITSCTNTSNPSVMLAAALVAEKAAAKGLRSKPWVKTSLAPGSRVVSDYYDRLGLWPALEKLGFHLVGYGCTTCIGNSGPLQQEVAEAVRDADLAVVSVLSGNRNFEGRINPDVKMNYLASPPLVIAYALAGTMRFDFATDSLGTDQQGEPVFLADLWPTAQEVQAAVDSAIDRDIFAAGYAHVYEGDEAWQHLPTPSGETFAWDSQSTYVRKPPYFDGMTMTPPAPRDIHGANVLVMLGDSTTTDHISPAGAIKFDSPAGRYLVDQGVARADFNSYGSRRGNHEVMMRGTFANIRLRNLMVPGTQGGVTVNQLDGQVMSIFDAAQAYRHAGQDLVVLAGSEYGNGSSRDWAAKGPALLGVKAVIAVGFERIHRSNLIGMGIVPLEFPPGERAETLGLDGTETFDITGISEFATAHPQFLQVRATKPDGETIAFQAKCRIDTPGEADYFRHGGILQYVLRSLVSKGDS